jgi:two-component system, chemotaxis family, response regulator Rcp1
MPIQVLLVEDTPGDVRLTMEAFRDANELMRMHVASDGVKSIPVFIVTNSEAAAEVSTSYQNGAKCSHREPVQWDAFEGLAKCICDLWMTTVKLPKQRQSG